MNYIKIYNNLIERAKNRNIIGYCEKHHILPKCLGGLNLNNIVKLTAREHFIAHMLLCRIYLNNKKLLYSLWRLINSKGKQGYKINSRTYEKIKIDLSIQRSIDQKGKIHSEETKLKISLSQKGIKKTDIHKNNLSINHPDVKGINNPMFNKKHSIKSKKIMIEKAKLRIGNKNGFFNKHHKKETIIKIQESKLKNERKSKYKIYCFNNNRIYLSLRDIEKDLLLDRKKVSLCCKNILNNIKGYKFQFI
jgi:hypothetical protein